MTGVWMGRGRRGSQGGKGICNLEVMVGLEVGMLWAGWIGILRIGYAGLDGLGLGYAGY